MATQSQRQSKPWTPEEEAELKTLVKQNTPTRLLGLKLERTEQSIRSKAKKLGISLRPSNQSPYG